MIVGRQSAYDVGFTRKGFAFRTPSQGLPAGLTVSTTGKIAIPMAGADVCVGIVQALWPPPRPQEVSVGEIVALTDRGRLLRRPLAWLARLDATPRPSLSLQGDEKLVEVVVSGGHGHAVVGTRRGRLSRVRLCDCDDPEPRPGPRQLAMRAPWPDEAASVLIAPTGGVFLVLHADGACKKVAVDAVPPPGTANQWPRPTAPMQFLHPVLPGFVVEIATDQRRTLRIDPAGLRLVAPNSPARRMLDLRPAERMTCTTNVPAPAEPADS